MCFCLSNCVLIKFSLECVSLNCFGLRVSFRFLLGLNMILRKIGGLFCLVVCFVMFSGGTSFGQLPAQNGHGAWPSLTAAKA